MFFVPVSGGNRTMMFNNVKKFLIHFPFEDLNDDDGFKQFFAKINKRIKMASKFAAADFSPNLWFTSRFEDFSKESSVPAP